MAGYWIQARYDGFCATKDCEESIESGDSIYLCDGKSYCKKCGEEIDDE